MSKALMLLVATMALGCAHPVTKAQWTECEAACAKNGGIKEACDHTFQGRGCHCGDDLVIWLDKGK